MSDHPLMFCDNLGTGELAWDPVANAKATEGLKFNAGKPRFDLIPPDALRDLAQLYEIGSRKYADRNWEKGMNWGKIQSSLMNHYTKWAKGEDYDDETGIHHMIAVMWNAIALYHYQTKGLGTDDRGL